MIRQTKTENGLVRGIGQPMIRVSSMTVGGRG